jgi:hypothetical protein
MSVKRKTTLYLVTGIFSYLLGSATAEVLNILNQRRR